MNTMNMPGFTAEDSLYKTSGHYQTCRGVFNSPTQMIGTIHLAAINVPGEVIVIVEEWPPDPWTPPLFGGHGISTPPTFDGGGGGGGGSPGPKSKPKKRTPEEIAKAREIIRCKDSCSSDQVRDVAKCGIDHIDNSDEVGRCISVAGNVFSRCMTRCESL